MKNLLRNTPLKLTQVLFVLLTVGYANTANAAETVNQATYSELNTLWMVIAAILVFFMQAGFSLLESGTSRTKNAVNVMMKNYIDLCFGSLIFFVLGFGLMMGDNQTGFIGMSHFMPTLIEKHDWTILFFQMMFAATAVTIASGAMAERAKFLAYLLSSIFICGLIYPIFASWVWGGHFGGEGWLSKLGFIDFAGSTVVHGIGGWTALAAVMVLGPRFGRFAPNGMARDIPGHNITLVALGGFILWFGWFGFNTGSAFATQHFGTSSVDTNLGKIALNTQLSACAGVVAIILIAQIRQKSILLSDTVNGSLAGLVAITAGCATMSPIFAIVTGLIAGFIYKYGAILLERRNIDDVVGAVPVHAFSGAWGTLAAGMFLETDLFNIQIIAIQLLGIFAAFVWGFGLSMLVYQIIDKTIGLRADTQHEQRGLDPSEHAELAYPEFQDQKLFDQKEMLQRR